MYASDNIFCLIDYGKTEHDVHPLRTSHSILRLPLSTQKVKGKWYITEKLDDTVASNHICYNQF